MEGWQKGADAVIKMSSAGKERYFQNFPERKEWFQANYPEHFGRSAAAATSSLKKVTKAKQQKQRLAAIRQAAEKRDQSTVLTPERRLMAQRRLQSGEGLAGGMDTVADIRKTIAAGMPVRSGGIGSLFEAGDSGDLRNPLPITKQTDANGKVTYCVAGNCSYTTREEAEEVANDNWISPGEAIKNMLDAMSKKVKGEDWPKPGEDPNWGKKVGIGVDPKTGKETAWMSQSPTGNNEWFKYDDLKILQTPPADTKVTSRDPSRRAVEPVAQDAGYYYNSPIKMNNSRSRTSNKNKEEEYPIDTGIPLEKDLEDEEYLREQNKTLAQQLAEKTIQECMPMPMNDDDKNWDDMKTWQDNPIPRMSKKSEADEEPGEYDYEGDMAKSQLRSIMHNSKMLHDMLEDKTNLPEWVQSKITLAEDYILTAANYMRGELDRMDEEVEQVDEAKKRLKPSYWRAEWRLGTETEVDKNNQKIYNRLAKTDPEKAAAFQENLMKMKKKDMKEEVEQIDEGADRWEYSGTVNGKKYTVTIPRGADLSDHLDLEEIQSENPHLEPHEVKAVADTSGEYEDYVEVEHEGEKYTHYVTNNEEPRMIYMDEEVDQIEEGKGYSPGWMLKKDPELGKELNDKINLAKKRQASYGKPKAGISVMPPTDNNKDKPDQKLRAIIGAPFITPKPATMSGLYITPKPNQKLKNYHTSDPPFDPNADRPEMPEGKHPEQYRYVRNLARKAMKAGIAATAKPETAEELVAQHNALHNPQGEVMEEGAGAARKVNPMDDLVKRSMLPDRSAIPPGKGFGDDIKKQKISKKVGKAIQKKRMARPTDNPSENELVPQSMLPDTPGYPQGYQMEEQVVEQPVEQQVETPVVEENTNPFVSAGSKFLTRTSARLVYGDKND